MVTGGPVTDRTASVAFSTLSRMGEHVIPVAKLCFRRTALSQLVGISIHTGINTPNCRRHVVKPAPSSVDSLGAAIESDLLASGFDPGQRTEETIHIDRGRLSDCKRFSHAGCSGPCRGCMKSRWLTISSNSWSVVQRCSYTPVHRSFSWLLSIVGRELSDVHSG